MSYSLDYHAPSRYSGLESIVDVALYPESGAGDLTEEENHELFEIVRGFWLELEDAIATYLGLESVE